MKARTYTQVARAEASEQTRSALLDAAMAAFFAEGEPSLEAIARDAGTTKQTLLRHFGSRQGLFEAAAEHGAERVTAERFAAPTDDVAGAVDNLLDHYDAYGDRALKLAAGGGDWGRKGKELHYAWVDHAFGRRLARNRRRRAALIALCDVQTWAILTRDLGMSRAETRATLVDAVESVLEGSP